MSVTVTDMYIGTGLQVVINQEMPFPPSDRENMRRFVRHGFADYLEWMGEDVGPKPGEPTHLIVLGGTVQVSQEMYRRLRAATRAAA